MIMASKIILDRVTNKGIRYQLRQFADKFVIFRSDTKIILPQQPSKVEWESVAEFSDETKAEKTFEKLL